MEGLWDIQSQIDEPRNHIRAGTLARNSKYHKIMSFYEFMMSKPVAISYYRILKLLSAFSPNKFSVHAKFHNCEKCVS